MRGVVACVLVSLLVAPLLSPRFLIAESPPVGPTADEDFVIIGELAVVPGPDAWTTDSLPKVAVRILNASFVPDLSLSVISLDAEALLPFWAPENGTLWMAPDRPLIDGPHLVDVLLRDDVSNELAANWTFRQDTVLPAVELDPLPPIADKRVYPVNGTVQEENLAQVLANGYPASMDGERFSVPVLLWPGRNNLLVSAHDHAGNEGLAAARIEWYPPPPEGASYREFVHENASFRIALPSSWEVELDSPLDGGFQAEVVAAEPPSAYARAGVAVVSRTVGEAMSEPLLLTIMEDAILRISGNNSIQVVARPEPITLIPGTSSAQFSVVETLPDATRVFRLVTAFWSRTLSRIWLVMGSMPTQTVEANWHAVGTATDSFRVIVPEAPPPPPGGPKDSIDRAFFVTLGAIALVVTLFAATAYSVRARRRPRRVPWER